MRPHICMLIFVFCSFRLSRQTPANTTPAATVTADPASMTGRNRPARTPRGTRKPFTTPATNITAGPASMAANTTGGNHTASATSQTAATATTEPSDYCPSPFALSGSNGTITSPRYPSPYPLDHSCQWTITVDPGKVVQLTFTAFELETGKDCAYDYLAVYGGTLAQGNLIGKFCGDTVPGPAKTTTNVMTVVLSTDGYLSLSGFRAVFVAMDKQRTNCGPGYFRCGDEVTCVDSWRRCDGRKDCFDNSDETGCACQDLPSQFLFCKGHGYNKLTLPNPYMHQNIREAIGSSEARVMQELGKAKPVCHPDFNLFACAMVMPRCRQTSPQQLLPCRTWCEEVTASCRPSSPTSTSWPFPDCSRFPYPSTNMSCWNAPIPENGHCYYGNGANYRGNVARTHLGQVCKSWVDEGSDFFMTQFPWSNLQKNYCRNPDGDSRPWCVSSQGFQMGCELPRCGAKTCGDPGPPRFGTRSPRKTFYLIGDKMTFSCGAGYILTDGSLRSTCQTDGTWSTQPPTCVLDKQNQLLTDLFERSQYKVEVQPSRVIRTSFQGRIDNVVDTNEKDERVKVSLALNLNWMDTRLAWSEEEYGNIKKLFMKDSKIWKPTLLLRNNADTDYKGLPASKVIVRSDGSVNWTVEALTTTTCTLDPYYFPVDTMKCPICFASTVSAGEILQCPPEERPGYNGCKTTINTKSGQWKIVISAQAEAGKGCLMLDFTRDPIYHIATTISPCIILAVLMCITFAIDIDKSDRIGFGITILLAMVVSLVVITGFLPVKDKMPFIAVVIIVCMGLIGLFMLFTVVIINLSSKEGDLPPWARSFFLRYLATFLLFGDLSKKKVSSEDKEKDNLFGNSPLTYVNGGLTTDQETLTSTEVTASPAQSTLAKRGSGTGGAQFVLQATLEELSRSVKAETRMLHNVLNQLIEANKGDSEDEESDYHILGRVLDRLCLILYILCVAITIPMALYLGKR